MGSASAVRSFIRGVPVCLVRHRVLLTDVRIFLYLILLLWHCRLSFVLSEFLSCFIPSSFSTREILDTWVLCNMLVSSYKLSSKPKTNHCTICSSHPLWRFAWNLAFLTTHLKSQRCLKPVKSNSILQIILKRSNTNILWSYNPLTKQAQRPIKSLSSWKLYAVIAY